MSKETETFEGNAADTLLKRLQSLISDLPTNILGTWGGSDQFYSCVLNSKIDMIEWLEEDMKFIVDYTDEDIANIERVIKAIRLLEDIIPSQKIAPVVVKDVNNNNAKARSILSAALKNIGDKSERAMESCSTPADSVAYVSFRRINEIANEALTKVEAL